jgi:hypothetical protein
MGKLIPAGIGSTRELHERPSAGAPLREFYDPLVADQCHPNERYSVISVGSVQFAYTTYEAHARALNQIWDAGLVPGSAPTAVRGVDLPKVAPKLQGVDLDLSDLTPADVEPRRRFS